MSAIGSVIDFYEDAQAAEKKQNYLSAARLYRLCYLYYEHGDLPVYYPQVEEYGQRAYGRYDICKFHLTKEAQRMLEYEEKGMKDWRVFVNEEYNRWLSEAGTPSPNAPESFLMKFIRKIVRRVLKLDWKRYTGDKTTTPDNSDTVI